MNVEAVRFTCEGELQPRQDSYDPRTNLLIHLVLCDSEHTCRMTASCVENSAQVPSAPSVIRQVFGKPAFERTRLEILGQPETRQHLRTREAVLVLRAPTKLEPSASREGFCALELGYVGHCQSITAIAPTMFQCPECAVSI